MGRELGAYLWCTFGYLFTHNYQSIISNILFELNKSINKKCLLVGGVDWKINNNTVVRPDIVLAYEEKVKYYIIVYPKDLKAKVYRLENGKYTKEGDFLTESYLFEETTCKASIDFESVFERFRS